eukprot:gene5916-9746_t
MKKTASAVNFFTKLFQNSEKNGGVEEKIDLTKYRLKYTSIYEFKELEKVFYQFLETEYNNYPLDYIRDCRDKIKEKMSDKEAIAAAKHLMETYIQVKSPMELNLSGKDRVKLLKEFEDTNQLSETKWVVSKTPQQIFNKIKDTMMAELGSDNFPRFIVCDEWKAIQKNYAGNDKVMEKLKIYDFDDGKNEDDDEDEFDDLKEGGKVEIIVEKIETPKVFQTKQFIKKDTFEEEEFKPDKSKAQELLKKGIEDFKKKQYKAAYTQFSLAIKNNDQLKEAYFNRGVLNFNLKRYLESIKDMVTVLEFDPMNAKAYSVRGMCLKNMGHYEQAIKDLKRSHQVETLPKNYMLFGICYDQLDELEKAIENYKEYLNHDSTSKNAMSVFHNIGHIYFQINKFELCVEYFTRAIEICETKDWIIDMKHMRAKANEKLGVFNEEDVIQFDDLDINDQYNVALTHYKAEEYKQGYDLFSKMVKKKSHENYFYLLGMCALNLSLYEEAIDNLTKSLEVKSSFDKPMLQLAKLYSKKRMKKKAVQYFDQLISVKPTAKNYFERSTYLLSINKKDEALKDLQNCIEINPEMDDAYYARGMSYFKDENYEQALIDFNSTLELIEDPDILCDRAQNWIVKDHWNLMKKMKEP